MQTSRAFLEEVQEKADSMVAFKKTFQRFRFSVDAVLKKVVARAHAGLIHLQRNLLCKVA